MPFEAAGPAAMIEVLGDLGPSDDSRTSFRSQISSVFRHPGKKDLYIETGARANKVQYRYLR